MGAFNHFKKWSTVESLLNIFDQYVRNTSTSGLDRIRPWQYLRRTDEESYLINRKLLANNYVN